MSRPGTKLPRYRNLGDMALPWFPAAPALACSTAYSAACCTPWHFFIDYGLNVVGQVQPSLLLSRLDRGAPPLGAATATR